MHSRILLPSSEAFARQIHEHNIAISITGNDSIANAAELRRTVDSQRSFGDGIVPSDIAGFGMLLGMEFTGISSFCANR